jgi:alcohol dehydrogenase class IV
LHSVDSLVEIQKANKPATNGLTNANEVNMAADVYATVGNDMGVSANSATAIEAVRDLSDQIQIRNPLSFYGVKQEMMEGIAEKVIADSVTSNNPIMPSKPEVLGILSSRL